MTSQEKRNRNLFISLIVLSVLTLIVFWKVTKNESSIDGSLFRVDDLNQIDQVRLERNGVVDLKYDGARWKVNNELADPGLIDVLFATLQQAVPVRPVARAQQDSVQQRLKSDGVKVSLLSGDQVQLRFTAGGNARKSQAYFQKENDIPYQVTIPGYRVYVSGIFELDKNGWKDKHVFQLNWRNFKSLEARFSGSSNDDFDVKFIDGFFSVEGMAAVDTTRLNDFLDAVSLLTVYTYSSDSLLTDSLKNSSPKMTIKVSDVADREYVLFLFPSPSTNGAIYGIVNSNQLAVFERKQIEPVLKIRSFFQQNQ